MATRSLIAYRTPAGTIRSVYCHYDGYIEHNGRILEEHYGSLDRISRLVSPGCISSLCSKKSPETENHTFGDPERDCTVFYSWDRNESYEDNMPSEYSSGDQWLKHAVEFNYLFEKGQWFVSVGSDPLELLVVSVP